ncbi:dipeptide/oligopeptide/nickel ABC transporter permease/ATP-binding protein [Curtobacterium sp. USHLN213]|uniref:dipeptide/oligopeptide/nickel ABC transporter permease/ATP-binding protein n=1 Tax=Curtobacterium sp. USHLN213 TaxID=3081255 RepID=UPI0030184D10
MKNASHSLVRRLLADRGAVTAASVLMFVILATVVGPWVVRIDPDRADASSVLLPPGGPHLLGTDSAGRDILARLIAGSETTLVGALVTVVVAIAIGTTAGVVAGYARGWFDAVATWISDIMFALPSLIIVLALIPVIGNGNTITMAAFGVLFAPGVFRITRSSTLAVRSELYIDAAKVSGLRAPRIIARHVVSVVRAPVIIQASIIAGIAISLQAGLGFLGVGDQSRPSWGAMLDDGFTAVYRAPVTMVWPGIAIAMTVACLVLFGNALRDASEGASTTPRRRTRRPAKTGDAAEAPSAAMVSIRNLEIAYPAAGTVVHGIDLDIRKGSVLGLVGESGSGKSQTSLALLGLLPDTASIRSGSIWFDGVEVFDPVRQIDRIETLRGRRIGYIPQEPMSNLDPSHPVGRYLTEPIRRHLGLNRTEAKARALDLLRRVGISDPQTVFASYPHEISGGMAQRVLIAGAVSCEPELLIADEPTTALDVTVQADVLEVIRALQREEDLSVLFITHDFGVVADLCDDVVVLQHGRIVEQATASELFAAPKHPYTKSLLDSTLENAIPRDIRDREVRESAPQTTGVRS